MSRLLLLALLFVGALTRPAAAQSVAGLPARPVPFQFVNDQAKLMAPADAKKLDGGLRRYADQTGTQVVVVTVPSLGGRQVSDYGRALGTAWGVGQRGKNNGLVVIVAAQEHKVTIQPGSGLVDKITPALTQRVIAQDFGPSFKQNNYFAGLRKGLSTLMLAANPASNPNKTTTAPAAAGAPSAAAPALSSAAPSAVPGAAPSNMATNGGGGLSSVAASADSTGPGIGTGVLLLGALVMGGLLYVLVRMFRRKTADSAASGPQASNTPNFYPNQPNPNQPNPNQPNRPGGSPNFLPNAPQGGNYGPGQAPNQGGGGFGMGSILATGAAAAAGAYLGNRMSEGHNSGSGSAHNFDANNAGPGGGAAADGAATGAAGTGAAGDYFAGRGGEANENAPDYFSDNNTGNEQSGDYFSSDDSSYDDTSSDDTGGGGFDDTGSDNSGSW